jgi:homoserine O-acetyltransferase/O-succinyltransferase
MKVLRKLQWGLWVSALVFIGFTAVAWAQVDLKPEYFVIQNFQFKSGEILKEMKVEFATFGTPLKDEAGNIKNAIVFCHGWSGNYSQINLTKNVFGPGKPVDSDKYFFICPTALGSPGSSCPSVSGLGPKFPRYTVADMISAQYRLVTEHFKIKRLAGVMGASMGGSQTLQWITQYPDFMDWAIPVATTAEFKGRNVGIFGFLSHAIKTDPAYQDGTYKEQPRKGMDLGFMGVYLWYFTPAFFKAQYKTNDDLLKGLKDAGLGSAKMDANDIIWRNDAMMVHSVKNDIPKVKARTLVIGVNTDELFPPEDEFIPIAKAIPGAKLFAYDSIFGHMGCAVELSKAGEAISKFLNQKD